MLELILCSLFTVLPDYLFRRYRQGKRWGEEITFFHALVRTSHRDYRLLCFNDQLHHGGFLFSPLND